MITIKDISNDLIIFEKHIDRFIDNLDDEKKFFESFKKKLVMESKNIIAAIYDKKIVGLCGIENKFLLKKSFIIISENFQGKGLGKSLLKTQIKKVGYKTNLLISVMQKKNYKSEQLYLSIGMKYLGEKDNQNYFAYYKGTLGGLYFYFLKVIFPLLDIKDRIFRILL